MIRAGAALALLLAALPAAAPAQPADDALRLARRIALGQGGGALTVHAPPAGLPANVILPAASLLGSVAHDGPAENALTGRRFSLYYEVSGDRSAALDAYRSALTKAGWKAHDALQKLLPQGGFTYAPQMNENWCAPGNELALAVSAPAAAPAGIDVSVYGGRVAALQCTNSPLGGLSGLLGANAVLPAFKAPANSTLQPDLPGIMGSTTAAHVTSSLSPAAVFDSFASQLSSAGWAAGESAQSGALHAQTFRKTTGGKAYVAVLVLQSLDTTHYAALAQVSASPDG